MFSSSLIQNCRDAIVAISTAGEIKIVNPAAEALFRRESSELVGQNVKILMPAVFASQHDDYLKRYVLSGVGHIVDLKREIPILLANGSEQKVDIVVSDWRDESGERFFVALLQPKADDSAKVFDESRNALVHGFIQDMRTPLNSILGFSSMLHDSSQDQRLREQLAPIIESSKDLEEIFHRIVEVLDFDDFFSAPSEEGFYLDSLCSDLHSIFSADERKKSSKVKFMVMSGEGGDELLHGDRPKIRRVIAQLLEQAFLSTPEGAVVLKTSYRDGKARFDVIDTGIGLSPEIHEVLSGNCVLKRAGRQGLGSLMVRRLIERLGGSIEIDSETGCGCRISFTVPLRSEGREPSVVISAEGERPHQLLVVVVEDNRMNALLATRMLESLGCTCLHAASGESALHLAEVKPDLIFMDLCLPGLDGLETARRLKANPRTASVPICALTANGSSHDVKECIDAGMSGFLEKPLKIDNLKFTLKRLFKN
ncbi:MAG: hypothetical protein RL095_2013 [Verrucomicrobiota bacterium]|jgi:PAS domain S-box-containing protein